MNHSDLGQILFLTVLMQLRSVAEDCRLGCHCTLEADPYQHEFVCNKINRSHNVFFNFYVRGLQGFTARQLRQHCKSRSSSLSLAGAATSIKFVATNACLSRQNTSFVATKVCMPPQNYVCRDKIFLCLSRQKFCRDKHTFIEDKICLCLS